MSYAKRYRQLAGDTAHGPSWYRAMGSIVSQPPGARVRSRVPALGSLGNEAEGATTLSTSTVQWQANVLERLDAGVRALNAGVRTAELQKWLQIAATLSIPLAAAVWRLIFKRGADPTV